MTKIARPVVRGNPSVDTQIIDKAKELELKVLEFKELFGSSLKNLSLETIFSVHVNLFRSQSHIFHALGDVEDVKRIRNAQSTAVPGGKRRKSKKVMKSVNRVKVCPDCAGTMTSSNYSEDLGRCPRCDVNGMVV